MATDDDDAATLRERVRELEQTVAQQQDTIQQLMPSRRAILAGGAGLVGGAALTGQASAQSAAGQVGTSSEPVDVEATTVNATDVNTDSVTTDSASVTNQVDAGSVNTNDLNRTEVGTRVFHSGGGTVNEGSRKQIEFDNIVFDDDNEADTLNNAITVNESGTYLIKSQATLGNGLPANVRVIIRVNVNTNPKVIKNTHSSISDFLSVGASTVVKLQSGDTITADISYGGGGSTSTDIVGGGGNTFLFVAESG